MLGSDRLIYRLEFKPKILLLQFTVNMVYELVLVRFITATALVLLVPKVEGEEQECKRFLPLNGANSHSADCSILEVHCSLMTNCGTPGSVCEQEIPWPPENARTCYRTCIAENATGDRCEASLSTVHDQPLRKKPDNDDFSLQRVFSPNYSMGAGMYRRSTICRYRVSCEGNRLLSYAVLEHSLEDVGSCSGQSLCTDSVNVYFDGYGTNVIKTTCGNEAELGEVQMDGLHEAWIEFKANRKKQFLGFEMFLWCIEPQFDLNYASFYSSSGQNQCNNPSPPGTGGRKKRSAISTLRQMDIVFNISGRDSSRRLPRYTLITVEMDESVRYLRRRVSVISRLDRHRATFTRVAQFRVYNRVIHHRSFTSYFQGTLRGYGYLLIINTTAYFLQEGVDPTFRPSAAEMKLIVDLQRGLQEALDGEDYFDVWDELDDDTNTSTVSSPYKSMWVRRNTSAAWYAHLSSTAVQFGRACNGLLRAAACAYQEVVLNTDCRTGLPIPKRTTTTTMATPVTERVHSHSDKARSSSSDAMTSAPPPLRGRQTQKIGKLATTLRVTSNTKG